MIQAEIRFVFLYVQCRALSLYLQAAPSKQRSDSAVNAQATWCPHIRLWAAIMMDFIPEAQTLLMVVAGVPRVKPEDAITDTFPLIKRDNKIQIS